MAIENGGEFETSMSREDIEAKIAELKEAIDTAKGNNIPGPAASEIDGEIKGMEEQVKELEAKLEQTA